MSVVQGENPATTRSEILAFVTAMTPEQIRAAGRKLPETFERMFGWMELAQQHRLDSMTRHTAVGQVTMSFRDVGTGWGSCTTGTPIDWELAVTLGEERLGTFSAMGPAYNTPPTAVTRFEGCQSSLFAGDLVLAGNIMAREGRWPTRDHPGRGDAVQLLVACHTLIGD